MDVEDKVVLKKRSKIGEVKFDSDDEPLGSLLKLKRSSKKAKLGGADGEKDKKVEVKDRGKKNEDFGEMEDTLACFKKKLKGPKKDKGCGNSKFSLTSCRALFGIDESKNVDNKAVDDREGGEGDPFGAYENLVEPLSSFLKKAESGVHKKPSAAPGAKLRSVVQFSDNDPGMPVNSQAAFRKNSLSDAKVSRNIHKSENYLPGSYQVRSTAPQNMSERLGNVPVVSFKSTNYGFTEGNTMLGEVCGEDEMIQPKLLMDSVDKFCEEDLSKLSAVEVDDNRTPGSVDVNLHSVVKQSVSFDANSSVIGVSCFTASSKVEVECINPEQHETIVRSYDPCIQHRLNTARVGVEDLGDNVPFLTNASEKVNGSSSPSVAPNENGDFFENKQFHERAVRRVKRRKDGDMAYEGDTAWEVSMYDQDKFYPQLENAAAAAAVSVGLKARALIPVEKIKFKEVLRRKGGLQQYLECRNKILTHWSKDVTRILPLTECGITSTPSDKEPFRASLMRDIYSFLDQNGYINTGIAANKDKAEAAKLGAGGSYKLVGEKKFEGSSGASVADSADGVSFILGLLKSPDSPQKVKDDVDLANENHFKEAAETLSKSKDYISLADELYFKEVAETLPEGKHNVSFADEIHFNEGAETLPKAKDDVSSADEIHSKEAGESNKEREIDASNDKQLNCQDVGEFGKQVEDVSLFERVGETDCYADILERKLEHVEALNQSMIPGNLKTESSRECNSKSQKMIIVVGAGPAGLIAARQLQRQGHSITVLEARSRVGGRVHTDHSSLSVPVDLGASIITGVEADVASERRPDPSSLICAQLGLELTILNSDCPLYDVVTGQKVPPVVDESLEAEFNSLLDDMMLVVAQKGESATRMSLEDGLEFGLKIRRKVISQDNGKPNLLGPLVDSRAHENDAEICLAADENDVKGGTLSQIERRVMDWHFAHLEYGCAALLTDVSLPHWNQDDVYGGFGGAHCMIKGGYGAVVESIAQGLPIHLNQVVSDISYGITDLGSADNCSYKVKVSTSNGNEFFGDAVLITVPLGCLKANSIKFSPPLPQWKYSAIQRLGFGVLNKVVLEFPEIFWDDTVDYFGATAEHTNSRGHCFMFWNVKKTVGAPVLIALVVGKAAMDGQDVSPTDHVRHALTVLRKLFGDAAVPDPVASVVTDWGRDPFSYGAYSYVAVGASGEDYDIIGRPVDRCLFFAGEATCKEHPDTVGGAMMSGLREAARIIDILTTGIDYTSEVEAIDAGQGQSISHRTEVRDITRRLDAVDITDAGFARESLLHDLFFTAKTSAGKLRLAKELLNLPVESLKSFAGTKEGLSVLKSWILDSLGKDGTQLLRQCVRILVLVSTDLVAVRLSGIGKTVKEKVCVHTSRDIRSIATQLVKMWIEVFRKEKATNGGLKLLRHMTNADSSKAKAKDPGSRKPPKRAQPCAAGNKGHLGYKKLSGKQVKLDIHSSTSQSSKAGLDNRSEDAEETEPLSEEARSAIAAAEAAHAAALAAIEAYASTEAKSSMMQLPKIPSFQKYARREQYAQMDEAERKRWSGGVLGRQDCRSEIDSRNCRVRDWSVDFSATCGNFENSILSADNHSPGSNSNDVPCQLNWKEHSGESAGGDNTAFTKAWVESSGSDVYKDHHAIERWQCQAAEAEYGFQSSMHIQEYQDEKDSGPMSRLVAQKHDGLVNESSVSQVTVNNELTVNQRIGTEHIKQGVVDYVASLLVPLYKAKKIDKEGYKSIMKKSATKVMEQTSDAEKAMSVSEFLDFKRKNKIRAFVDKLIERHMSTKRVPKP